MDLLFAYLCLTAAIIIVCILMAQVVEGNRGLAFGGPLVGSGSRRDTMLDRWHSQVVQARSQPLGPVFDPRLNRWRDPKTKRFVAKPSYV